MHLHSTRKDSTLSHSLTQARLTAADANVTNSVVRADPCALTLHEPRLISTDSGFAVALNVSAVGYCGATYALIAAARPRYVTSSGAAEEELGRVPLTLAPRMNSELIVPVAHPEALDSVLVVSMAGADGQVHRVATQLAQEAFEFSFDEPHVRVVQSAIGSAIALPVLNKGLQAAAAVTVRAYEVFADDSKRLITSSSVQIGAFDRVIANLTLPLTAEVNVRSLSVCLGCILSVTCVRACKG